MKTKKKNDKAFLKKVAETPIPPYAPNITGFSMNVDILRAPSQADMVTTIKTLAALIK